MHLLSRLPREFLIPYFLLFNYLFVLQPRSVSCNASLLLLVPMYDWRVGGPVLNPGPTL